MRGLPVSNRVDCSTPPPAHPKKETGRGRHPSGKLCAACGKPAITREGTADKAPRPHERGMQIQGYGNKKNCNNYDKGVRKGDMRTIATNLKRCEKAGFESPLTPDDIKNALGCVIGMPGACGCTVAPRRASRFRRCHR
jgi:hypothetical protein